jgi:hypothetical protein
MSNGQSKIASNTTNKIRGHNSDGITGENIWEKSIYITTELTNNITEGNYTCIDMSKRVASNVCIYMLKKGK